MPLGMEVGLGPDDFVLDGDQAPRKKRGTPPIFFCLSNVFCGQTAGWIKMPLGTEIGLGPGDIVLDWAQLSPLKGHSSPSFWPLSIVVVVVYCNLAVMRPNYC